MTISANTAVWFEIPAKDLERASTFYETVLNCKMMDRMEMGPCKMAVLPAFGQGDDVVHGALVVGPGYEPSQTGSIIYLNGGADLSQAMARVEGAGGKILQDKFAIGEHGHCGFFQDTEGNKIGIHSQG